jgi:hypothetical protein
MCNIHVFSAKDKNRNHLRQFDGTEKVGNTKGLNGFRQRKCVLLTYLLYLTYPSARNNYMIGGASIAVANPFKQMARLPAAPGRRPSCKARAVPMPW